MTVFRRLVSEPLFQFLLIGAVVFGAWSVLGRSQREVDLQVIEVGPGRIAQLLETFSRTWQRPPTRQELNGLIDAFVKEEVFYREGRKMGLDQDDTVFRRRLQQKMEFLMEPREEELNPTDGVLQGYLTENAETLRVPARVAFRQIFFDPAKRGDSIDEDIAAVLAALEGDGGEAAAEVGDPTLLPQTVPLRRTDQLAHDFGDEFAEALSTAETRRWTGPVTSTFGRHLVFVYERTEARDPELDEVRDLVLREWQSARRRVIAEERYQALRKQYEVKVAPPVPETTSATGAAAAN